MSQEMRPILGNFSSIVCFKALVVGIEDTIGGQAALVSLRSAGRKRGKELATSLGFGTKPMALTDVTAAMQAALGPNGTRLCIVDSIEESGGVYTVNLSETVCSAGEPQGSTRELSFTLGAIHGAMEVLTQSKMRAKQTGSVLRGQSYDIVTLTPV